MGRDVAVTVAEGLEESDLAAFDRNQTRKHHPGEQCGDQEKHRRQDARQRAQLLDLVHEEPVRQLVGTRVGPHAAVAAEHVVEALDDGLRIGATQERNAHLVEGAFEAKRALQRLTTQPDHAESPVVGHERAGRDRIHVFGRERDANHRELTPSTVHDRPQPVAHPEAVSIRKRLGHNCLVDAPARG